MSMWSCSVRTITELRTAPGPTKHGMADTLVQKPARKSSSGSERLTPKRILSTSLGCRSKRRLPVRFRLGTLEIVSYLRNVLKTGSQMWVANATATPPSPIRSRLRSIGLSAQSTGVCPGDSMLGKFLALPVQAISRPQTTAARPHAHHSEPGR